MKLFSQFFPHVSNDSYIVKWRTRESSHNLKSLFKMQEKSLVLVHKGFKEKNSIKLHFEHALARFY